MEQRPGGLSGRLERAQDRGEEQGPSASPSPSETFPHAPVSGRSLCRSCGAANPGPGALCAVCGDPVSGVLEFELWGNALRIGLEPGQQIYAPLGSLSWMSSSLEVAELAGDDPWSQFDAPGIAGVGALVRFTARRQAGNVVLTSHIPGAVRSLAITRGQEYVVNCNTFLVAQETVSLGNMLDLRQSSPDLRRGTVLRRLGGRGLLCFQTGGEGREVDLRDGESVLADPDAVALARATVSIGPSEAFADTRQRLGQSGLVEIAGPGTLWFQSASPTRLQGRLI